MKIEQFIRKLNNTELNSQSTNDAYIRVSKSIRERIPDEFFGMLDSKKIKILNRNTGKEVGNWVRYQYYPSNKEYRIVNLNSVYKSYKASPGDYVYIERIQNESEVYYEIYMKTYQKVCMKYSKSNEAFEILNEDEVIKIGMIEKGLNLQYRGEEINSKIVFSHLKKKRSDSPSKSTFYTIENLPNNFYDKIGKDHFVEIFQRGDRYFIDVMDSWSFNKFSK